MTTVWFLILINLHGGTSAVPQASAQQCIQNANWINGRKFDNDGYFNTMRALCVAGRQ